MGYIVVPANSTTSTSSVLYGTDIDFQQANIFSSTSTLQQEAVAQFKNLLLTFPGERFMNPTFGCNLKRIIFEPNVYTIKEQINNIIENAVAKFCPFIVIDQINIITGDDDPTMNNDVSVKIDFSVSNSPITQRVTITGKENGNVSITSKGN
jgi:phage baseplate assembly protein W